MLYSEIRSIAFWSEAASGVRGA